ncbi:arrestin domain-containing protein 2-like [Cydia pomonella]|uniref:arrestin domain-containing protein 2-like n=1 Tax=Cydia pomonella TaxID=82600 RepID=UPI002ADD6F3A|nr:arrestin domain-containing protein 2-like [Cydia pomonella]
MGIFCQISLCKPADDNGRHTYQPGSFITGGIRYAIDEEYNFRSITVSLRGRGHLYLEDLTKKRRRRMYTYTNDEIYVNLDEVLYTFETDSHPVGQFNTQFSFQLPHNIPATTDYFKGTVKYLVKCYVKYVVSIKFEMLNFFTPDKQYEKEIHVISVQTPRLTMKPLVYGDQKSLLQINPLCLRKKDIVNLKALMMTSVLRPGERVKVEYEINNDANKTIKGIQVKISEVDQYTSMGGSVFKNYTDVEGAEFSYATIPGGEIVKFTAEIRIPEHCASIEHCKFLARDYAVMTVVRLPGLHVDMPLEIPFQVIKTVSSSDEENYCVSSCARCTFANVEINSPRDDPPTYWEVMAEGINGSWKRKGSKGDAII